MRTTIEITKAQHIRLLKLAAERKEKGFSRIVQEAIERYLSEEAVRATRAARALATLGTLGEEEAEGCRAVLRETRDDRNWR